MSYRQALSILEALPEDQRMLAAGVYIYTGDDATIDCGCVWGKISPQLRMRINTIKNSEPILSVLPSGIDMLGMTYAEAELLQTRNDACIVPPDGVIPDVWYGATARRTGLYNNREHRQLRYKLMVEWLRQRVSAEPAETA